MFMYINIAENAHWDIYAPPLQIITQIFFHFRCILLQISPQKFFFFYKYFYTRRLCSWWWDVHMCVGATKGTFNRDFH